MEDSSLAMLAFLKYLLFFYDFLKTTTFAFEVILSSSMLFGLDYVLSVDLWSLWGSVASDR